MVSDAAKGLTSGARAAFPELKLRGDMFHGKREVGRLLRYLEKRGYDALKSAERRAHERDNPGRNDDAYELGQRCRRAGERADLAMHHHDQTLIIGREFFELIEAVDLMSGELRDAEAAIERITILGERLTWLSHEKCKKVGRFIKNQAKALCAWISQFTLALSNIGQSPEEDRAVRVLAHIWRLDQACARPQNAYRLRQLEGLRKRAVDQLAELDLEEGVLEALLQKTADVIAHRRRASSLVEAFNSVLRPWVEAHRRVTQGALDLFAAWWNFRTRKLGQRAPHCAYTALSGVLVPDWLSMLGFPPSGAWS
jgi:hypothetical protein